MSHKSCSENLAKDLTDESLRSASSDSLCNKLTAPASEHTANGCNSDESSWRRTREHYVYLAEDSSGRVVKVGISCNPSQRVDGLGLGKVWVYPNAKSGVIRFRLVRAWSVGVSRRGDATRTEQSLHRHLRKSAVHKWEYYRMATSRAEAIVDAWMSSGPLLAGL